MHHLLVLDEIGYVPVSKARAKLLFEVPSRACERQSVVLMTNLSFEQWTDILGGECLIGTLFDRLAGSRLLDKRGMANGREFCLFAALSGYVPLLELALSPTDPLDPLPELTIEAVSLNDGTVVAQVVGDLETMEGAANE